MAHAEELDKAIAAHGMWKARLRTAISTGKLDLPVETIRANNQCVFGKWLASGSISVIDRASEHYKTVRQLHSDFHLAAARVAELALEGKKSEAENLMNLGGNFTEISTRLTKAMMEWKKNIK